MILRNIRHALVEALTDTPVVLLLGARQSGKSTLVKSLSEFGHPAHYVTLDDATALAAASRDPAGFVASLQGPVIIDEVQRAPELFLALKAEVDRARTPGRFLLTGSANVLLLPRLSDSLAGRMEILTLWPLSCGEMASVKESFVDRLFAPKGFFTASAAPVDRAAVFDRILRGGFPEPALRASASRRRAWFASYITTILQRDVQDLAGIEHVAALPAMLSLLAARSAALMNYAELGRSLGMPQTTLKRYIAILDRTYLIRFIPAWSSNLGKRLVKSPKLIFTDTGLLAHLRGCVSAAPDTDWLNTGPLLENFVATELCKQISWSSVQPNMYHFRTSAGQEVDLILEDSAGRVAAIEVKSASTVTANDFRHIQYLKDALGKRFVQGVVLYTGDTVVPFSHDLWALPISTLWSTNQ